MPEKTTRGPRHDAELARQFANSLKGRKPRLYPRRAVEALYIYWLGLDDEGRAKLMARWGEWTMTRKVKRKT